MADTSGVKGRRVLRFATPAEALADARRIVDAEKAGTLRRLGNWTVGQSLGHVASWINYAFDGYPFEVPQEMAARARGHLPMVLEKGMSPGFGVPGVEGGTAGIADMKAEDGLRRLAAAWSRLQAACPPRGHAFFGELTHGQWIALNLRHSELHQGFMLP